MASAVTMTSVSAQAALVSRPRSHGITSYGGLKASSSSVNFELGSILHFDKLKFQNVNLISEQYLPSHREVETGCWYPMALGRRRSSQAGVQPSRPKGEQPLLAER